MSIGVITGVNIRDRARTHDGKYRYDTADQSRCTGAEGFVDCSGSVVLTCNQEGLYGVPTVSALQARWCRDNGTDGISITTALETPGCLLFEGPNHGYDGWGNDGHVCITTGNGITVIEARGHAYPATWEYSAAGRPWSNAAYIPTVDYVAHQGPAPHPIRIPKLVRKMYFIPPVHTLRGDDVLHVQGKLAAWAWITAEGGNLPASRRINPTIHDGVYSRRLAHNIAELEKLAGIRPDAMVTGTSGIWRVLNSV